MYLIPKNLEVKLAFPEFTIFNRTFQILAQDLVFLIALPLILPYALAKYEVIPDFDWLKICCGMIIFGFVFYLVVWACPTPKLKNYDRLAIWWTRPKQTYYAPPTGHQQFINVLEFNARSEDDL